MDYVNQLLIGIIYKPILKFLIQSAYLFSFVIASCGGPCLFLCDDFVELLGWSRNSSYVWVSEPNGNSIHANPQPRVDGSRVKPPTCIRLGRTGRGGCRERTRRREHGHGGCVGFGRRRKLIVRRRRSHPEHVPRGGEELPQQSRVPAGAD